MKIITYTILILITVWTTIGETTGTNENITDAVLNEDTNSVFDGVWFNVDEQTRFITKCKIQYKNESFVVQMWGACHPQDCDWGENVANDVQKGTDKFQLLWDQEFAESLVTYEIIDGKLKVTNKRHYKDNSGRSDRTSVEYFQKE